jgi:hypothetical protein
VVALRVLGVHGVGNWQPGLAPAEAAERLSGWWRPPLLDGLGLAPDSGALSVEVAYYAHRLAADEDFAQGAGAPDLSDPELEALVVAWARALGLPDEVIQGRLSAPARAAVSWVVQTRVLDQDAGKARRLVSWFFGEVHRYFTEPDRRRAVIGEVVAAIDRLRPEVIVAHSLGSVVTYEALWSARHAEIPLLLTLGSPLAMPQVVYERLAPVDGAHRRPPRVGRWVNVADPGDLIAVPPGGVSRGFGGLAADITDSIGTFDFHRVVRYLRCGATSGAIAAYL